MKIHFFYLLISLFVYLSKCEEIVIPTNYTLSYFQNVDTKKMTCKSDSDCPQFSKCEKNDNGNGSVCVFSNFLCPLTLTSYFHKNQKEDEYCLYVNTDMWNLDTEEMNESYPKNTKPILKTCLYLKIKADGVIGCSTERCDKNEDCLSGNCLNHMCYSIENLHIYRCTGNKNNVKCGKHSLTECRNDDECYSGNCISYRCIENEISYYGKLFGHIILVLCILFGIIALHILLLIIVKNYKRIKNNYLKFNFDNSNL